MCWNGNIFNMWQLKYILLKLIWPFKNVFNMAHAHWKFHEWVPRNFYQAALVETHCFLTPDYPSLVALEDRGKYLMLSTSLEVPCFITSSPDEENIHNRGTQLLGSCCLHQTWGCQYRPFHWQSSFNLKRKLLSSLPSPSYLMEPLWSYMWKRRPWHLPRAD